MGANFFRAGGDETATSGTPWEPGAAVEEWTMRMRQATSAARALLAFLAPQYGLKGVTFSYAAGISNGGYQTRRAIETDFKHQRLYDGGVDWEGTLFLGSLPAGIQTQTPTTGYNLFTYLPTALLNYPGDVLGVPASVQALAAVGFNPQSQPLWAYHWAIYWGLTQKIYRLEFDPEYTNYTCSDMLGAGPSCVSPAALAVPPTDPDALYDYAARVAQNPAILARMQEVANTGNIQRPLITLHGDQDSLLPIATDSDLYSQLVARAHKSSRYRYYVVQGGNHVDPQFDDHYGVDPACAPLSTRSPPGSNRESLLRPATPSPGLWERARAISPTSAAYERRRQRKKTGRPNRVMQRPIAPCSGCWRKVETTTAAQTAMNASVVSGCPGILRSVLPRLRKTKTAPAVRAKKMKSMEVT
jgi:fermentation-respiration switch protein FrsA (DUF1100 family)